MPLSARFCVSKTQPFKNNPSTLQINQANLNPTIQAKSKEVLEDQPIDLPVYSSTANKAINSPKDWSEEIYDIDFEIKRIGWSKEQEDHFRCA